MKTVLKADDGGSAGSQFSDVGPTHLTDHGGYVPQSGTSEPGSYNISDVGMTCPIVTSDPMLSDKSKSHTEITCSQTDHEKILQNEFNCIHMNNDTEAKKSEKETCNQTDTATSVGSKRYVLSRQHGSSEVPCKTIVLGSFNQADHMFSDQSRGSQCSVNALCLLIFAKFSHLETRYCVNKVLLAGDILYNSYIWP